MKSYLDKYSKVGSLSLHLQKYEVSPKIKKEEDDQTSIKAQEIQVPKMKNKEIKNSDISSRSKSKDRSKKEPHQKSSTIHISPGVEANGEHQDEEQIFARCLNLTSKIEFLKKEKFQHAVQQFAEQQRKKMEYLLQKQKKLVNHKYNQKRNQLKGNYQRESTRLLKALEDIKKLKQAYKSMIQDLSDRRAKINSEYESSIGKVRESKEKLISQWKRSSNEEIIKKSSKTF